MTRETIANRNPPLHAACRLLAGLALALTGAAQAADDPDRGQPVSVHARSIHLDQKSGVVTYTGDVRLTQGSLELRADRAITRGESLTPRRITAWGKPVSVKKRFRDGLITISARRAVYDSARQVIEVFESVTVERGDAVLNSEYMLYELDTEQLTVKGLEPGRRVHAVFTPGTGSPPETGATGP